MFATSVVLESKIRNSPSQLCLNSGIEKGGGLSKTLVILKFEIRNCLSQMFLNSDVGKGQDFFEFETAILLEDGSEYFK